MNYAFGVVHFDGRPVSRQQMVEAFRRMSASRAGTSHSAAMQSDVAPAMHIDGSTGMACALLDAGSTLPMCPYRHEASGVVLCGTWHLYDRRALESGLSLGGDDTGAGLGGARLDAALLAEAYLRWGNEFAAHVRGDFAVALWDPRTSTLVLARDHLGCLPLFYARTGDTAVFASTMGGVLAMVGGGGDSLDPEWVADLVIGCHGDADRTAYRGVRRVRGGHVQCERAAGSSGTRYWTLLPRAPVTFSDDRDYELAFRERLEEAVRIRLPEGPLTTGAELSGGLDSSAVAAIAAAAAGERGARFVSLSHVLPDALVGAVSPYTDERAWVEQVLIHAKIERHEAVDAANHGIVSSLRRLIQLEGAPPRTYVSVFSDALYDRAAANGAHVLFSGYGGDEVVSSQASLALEGTVARRDWRRVVVEWRARGRPGSGASRRELLRNIASLGLGRTRRRRTIEAGEADAQAKVDVLGVRPDYATHWRLRERAVAAWSAMAEAATDTQAYERQRIQDAGFAVRLESCGIAAGACGLVYRYPLLDVPLLEYYHAVPDEQKERAGWGRFLFRRSIEGLVPDSIRWRNDKSGAIIPHHVGRFGNDASTLRALVGRSRERPELDFLDFSAVDRQLGRVLEAAAGRRDSRGMRWGRFAALLGLLVYWDLRSDGWRP